MYYDKKFLSILVMKKIPHMYINIRIAHIRHEGFHMKILRKKKTQSLIESRLIYKCESHITNDELPHKWKRLI